MYTVDLYLRVRLACHVDGLSQREAASRFGIARETVRKMLRHSEPPGYRRRQPPKRPKLAPFTDIIDRILEEDRPVHRKQHHTAKRIFERLRDEHGFTGKETIVKDYVRERRLRRREMFVPLSHPPGHAQADFGEADAIIAGVKYRAHFVVMTLPHSDACFVATYPAATTEAWLDGHNRAFVFFGGVPQSILYDNDKCLVSRILSDGTRQRTRAFSGLQSHDLFEDRYGRPGKGNDKGNYSLFVERAMTLVKPDGMVGLLTPSGIASDKTAARFFKGVATEGRLKALYDFENKKVFFPDVHASFKFCIFVASPSPIGEAANCAFYLHDISERDDPERCFPLTAESFARVNPNTGTAPIFRTRRDAALTTAIYDRLPVLVDRSSGEEVKAWPVRYSTMFHMTNDSGLFRTRAELEEREGAYPIDGNRFASPAGEWVPLYEGKMVQAFDHRAANVIINPENRHRPAQPQPATPAQHRDPDWLPDPQYWVPALECGWTAGSDWVLGFKEITAPTNVRTFIAALFPTVGFGNKVPILKSEAADHAEWLLAANLNATILDFVTRQKIQGQTLNLFIIEQLPVAPPDLYKTVCFGPNTAGEIILEAVLELTYTAHDMAPFARDMGHVDATGDVLQPFVWNEERRLQLRAKLDAVFFHLYGVTDRDDVRYIYSTFPIVEREETAAYGTYRSRDLCLAWMNALAAGHPDAEIVL